MDFQSAKGTRDLLGNDAKLREDLKNILKEIFQKYGYLPLESPIIENLSVLTKKSAGGSEINKEIFKLKDQGKRDLGLRFDLTVPLCRFISNNPQIKIPFKRYNIGEVFRDGPIKLGRYRQFTQADCDIIGVNSFIAEAELLKLVNDVFEKLEVNYEIKLNSRVLVNEVLDYCNIKEDKQEQALLSIDKLDKIGNRGVINELKEKRISENSINKLFDILENKNSLEQLSMIAPNGVNQIKELIKCLEIFEVKNYEFDITLARGLNYYTGSVFEVKPINTKIKSSILGGGRYDNLISSFTENKLNYSAVGLSFGIDPILEILKDKQKQTSIVKLFIISINQLDYSIKIINQLRKNNINCDIDLLQRSISKSLDYANKLEIPYVIFIGEKELKTNKLKLRDMKSGQEELLSLPELIKKLK